MIVGNKSDLKHLREVKSEDAAAYAEKKKKVAYIETSALDSSNVDMAFQRVIGEIYQLYLEAKVNNNKTDKDVGGGDVIHIERKPNQNQKKDDTSGSCCSIF